MSEGTTRGEAAAHILAREMGRRARAIQARIDDVERARAEALAEVQARLIAHDGVDERHAGLIDGLRADLGETHRTVLDAVATGDAEVRQLTEAQASLIDRIAQRVTQAEDDNARQDADVEVLTTRVDAVEAKAAIPGPKGEKGDKGDRGPRGPAGPAGFSGAGGGTSGGAGTVTSVAAGTGITVGGTSTDPVITNSGVNSVTAGTGVSVSGTTALTVTNTGVTSLTGSGVTVSASTGAVTVTAPTVSGGTGISVAGSGTTSLTVSATGVQSLTAGAGISVSGTTTPTITNSGVTSIVAGTNVTVSGATGAVTVNAPGFATPGSSAIGDTAAAGTATTVSRSDHVHGREAAGTPGASAVGDTASAGVATTVARSDHRHSREAFGTPVNIDASLTSLSAGSLTTVARADHVHTVSNVPVLLGSVTLSSTSSSITFNNIPQTSKHLMIYGAWASNRFAQVADGAGIRFNGDSTSAYYTSSGTLQTYGDVANPQGATAMSGQIGFNHISIYIPAYTTTSRKQTVGIGGAASNNTFGQTVNTYGCIYNNTSAVSSITLITLYGGSFTIGTSLQLWGYG